MLSTLSTALLAGSPHAAADCPHREYGWTAAVGGEGEENSQGVAVASDGTVYATGAFAYEVDFNPSKKKDKHHTKGRSEKHDIYLTSYNPDGSYRWTVSLGGRDIDTGQGVAASLTYGAVITGSFKDVADFNPTRRKDKRKSVGRADISVTLIRENGSYGWTQTFGGVGSDIGFAIAVDGDGNILLTGWFQDVVDFDPGPGEDPHTAQGSDVFVTKLGPDGSYHWTRTFGGPHFETGWAIAAGPDNSVIVTGEFYETVDFDPGPGQDLRTSNGKQDFFITKLGPDGSYHWTHTAGGVKNDSGRAVTTDPAGNVYVTGAFEETVDFNPRGGGDVRVSEGVFDIYIIKLGPDGSYRWTKTFGGEAIDAGFGIALGPDNVLGVTGGFNVTVDFDPSEGVDEHTSNGGRDVFITRFTTDGDYRFTDTFGGIERDGGEGIAFDADGNVVACGAYDSQDVDFDPTGGVDVHSSNGSADIFITKHYCGQCEVLDGHHVQGKRGKIKATIQTTAPGGSVKIEYTGPGDPIVESFDIDDTGQASFKLKKLKEGDYHCLITKIKDPAGQTLCQGPLAPRTASVK